MGWTTSSTTPTKLGFVSSLGLSSPGALMVVQPAVAVLNENGIAIATANGTLVTIELSNAPAGVTLECEGGLSMRVKDGVARFKGCRVSTTGMNFLLVASSADLPPASSQPFAVITRGNNRVAIPLVVHE